MVRKAAYATITGGLVSFLVANGIYIPNDETLILVAFALVVRVLYVKLSPLLTDLIDSGINVCMQQGAAAVVVLTRRGPPRCRSCARD